MGSQLNETPLEGKYKFFGRLERLGSFEDNVNSIFKEVFPGASGGIRHFSTKIDEGNIQTDIEKQAKEFAIKLVSKAEELKSLSEKVQNGTISERTEVEKTLNILLSRRRDIEANSEMKYSNLMFLPSSIRNDLMKRKEGFNTEKAEQYLNEVQEKISPFSNLLLDKGKIKDFLAQENFYEKKNALNVYISFLESLRNKGLLSKIEKKVAGGQGPDDLEQTFGVELYENIAQIATLFNYDTIGVVPAPMKQYLNTVSHDGLKRGYFDAQTIYLYVTTEEGIFGLKRKTVKDGILQETRRSVTNQEYFNNLDKYFKNFPGYSEVTSFWLKKGGDIQSILTTDPIGPSQISSYEAVKNAFDKMLRDVEKKYGYIPWELLEMKDRIENLKAPLYEKAPEGTDAARMRKMVRYLETCRLWLDAKSYDASDKVLIDTLIKQVKSGEVLTFSKLNDGRSGKIDSRTIDLLQAFTNDVQTNLAYYFKNSEGKNNEMEQLEKENLGKGWIWNITMEELDKFLEKFNDSDSTKVEFNFGRIESAIAQSFDSSQDSIGFQIMSKEVLADISKNPSALNRISNLDPAKIEKMKKDVALDFRKSGSIYEDFVKQVRNIPLATRQKMVLKENPSFQITEGNSLEKEVVDILINQAAKEGAMVSLTMSTVKDIFSENPDMFSEQSRKFLAHITDNTRWWKELAVTVCKEAALFLATEAITFGVGGFVMGAARGSLWLSRGIAALNESRGIAGGIARTGFFLGRTAFEAGTYTVLSNGVNKGTLSVEGYTESLVGFLGPIAGAKIAGKFIPFGSSAFSQTIKEIMGGALGGAAATGSLMLANGQEISFDDLKNMTRQGAIMGAVMIPMMKAGAPIGKWVGEKAAGTKFIQDRIDSRLTRKINELEIKTNGQRDHISQKIEDYKTLLDSLRRDNRFVRLGLKESTINRFNSIISEFKSHDFEAKKSEIEALENEKAGLLGDAKNNARISEISKKIDEIKTEMTNLQLKMEQAKKELGDDIEQVAGNLSDTEMREFINEKLGKVSPLSRLRGEIEGLRKFAKFGLEEKWNNFREMKLESYRNLREMRGATYIENGFYFNEGKIQTAMGETILTLPESAKVLGIEYYKIGNKQIPCLEIKTPTDTKLVRLNPEARNLPQELFEKVVFNKVEIQGFYDKNNVELLGYKVIENDGSFSYYRLRADNSLRKVTNNDAINEDGHYLHSLASSKGISLEELNTYGINPKEGAKLRRQWDREIDEILTPEVVEKMQKKLVEDVKQVEETIKKSPLISIAEKTLLLRALGKIVGIPLWPLKQMWKHKIITFVGALYFFPDQTKKGIQWGIGEMGTLLKGVELKDWLGGAASGLAANQIIGKGKMVDTGSELLNNFLIGAIGLGGTFGTKEIREWLGNK